MREPSASQLALAAACQHPWTSGTRWPEETSSIPIAGKRVHRILEGAVTGEAVFPEVLAPPLSASEVETVLATAAQGTALIERERSTMAWQKAELWLRYCVETGAVKLVQPGTGREPGWWSSIIDYVAETAPGEILVRDWKTGRPTGAKAEDSAQLRLCALAAAKYFGARRVWVELAFIDPGDVWFNGVRFDRFDLACFADDLRKLRRRIIGGPTPPVPGPHCTDSYCPLRGVCPATRAALSSAFPIESDLVAQIRDEAHARWIIERLAGAQAALDAVKSAVKEYAKTTPIHGADGKVYAWRDKTRRAVKVDTEEQRAALRSILGEHAEKALKFEWTTSVGAIEDAARAALEVTGKTRGLKRLVDDTLDALGKAGGMNVQTWQEPEWFKPKEQ